MIKYIAIDDEPLALRQIRSYAERIPDLEEAASCSSAAEAQRLLDERQVDLLFVDINMPDLNGVDFVRGLRNPPMVIFTTAYSEYAVESFRLDAVDYLLKPFGFDDFNRAVGKARSLSELMKLRDAKDAAATTESETASNEYISVKAGYKVSLVKYADIIYMESVGEYVFRLKNMESALPAGRFMRVHRSYIVNLAHVSGYARGRVYLDNEEYVPLSVNYRDAFREYIDGMNPTGQSYAG